MNDNHFKFSASVILLPFLFVLTLWLVFWLDIRFYLQLDDFGIYPRSLYGLKGVLFSPFLHANLEHLYNNSIPLFVLLAAIRFFYREISIKVVFLGILMSGTITWIIGREAYHIGASGLIYVLVSFVFFKGIFTAYYRLVALSFLVVLLYGSMIWYVFPNVQEGISWEGHLAGFISGLLLAMYYKTPEYVKYLKYDWQHPDFNPEEDLFMKHFDENGNFVNTPKPEESEDEIAVELKQPMVFNYVYVYKQKEEDDYSKKAVN